MKNLETFINDSHNNTVDCLKRLSYDNRNIISWYSFKKNSEILIINAKAIMTIKYLNEISTNITIINDDDMDYKIIKNYCNNVNAIYGDIKSIQIEKSYDYIIIENLGKYDLKDLLFYSSSLLKINGKIFYFFSNDLGLNKLITNSKFNNVNLKSNVKGIVESLKMNSKFYYVFPNHYVPEIIFTDEYLSINKNVSYNPIYFDNNVISNDERVVLKKILANANISDFSNSYLVIIGKKNVESNILFAKYNNYRKKEYSLITYYKNNRYYKKANFTEAAEFIDEVMTNHKNLKKMHVNIADSKKENNEIYSNCINGSNLYNIIKQECYEDVIKTENYLTQFWIDVKNKYNNFIKFPKNNIFTKYSIKIDNEKIMNLNYVEKLYIDMIPQNVIVKDNENIFFDQEWEMEKAPIEFLLYRIIRYTIPELNLKDYSIEYFLDKLGLKEYSDIFKELEDSFIESTQNSWYKYYLNYQRPCSIESLINQLEYKEHQINDLTKSIVKLENDVNNLNAELRNIVNSKSWKITKPLRNFRKRKNR